jgi:hypothetical protein
VVCAIALLLAILWEVNSSQRGVRASTCLLALKVLLCRSI